MANDEHVCPEPGCDRAFGTGRGLARHRTAMHSTHGSNGKVKTTNGADPQALLADLFPDGVPPEKVPAAAVWLEATEALVS